MACLLFSKLWTGLQLSKGIVTLNGVKGAISSTVPFVALRVTTGAEPPLRTAASQDRLRFHPFGSEVRVACGGDVRLSALRRNLPE